MLTKDELQVAAQYNVKKSGILWGTHSLPWPWSVLDPASNTFAMITAVYQNDHGLKMDGWLGPSTLSVLRQTAGEDSSDPVSEEGSPFVAVPPPSGVSNQVVADNEFFTLPDSMIAEGFTCRNYKTDGIHHFDSHKAAHSLEVIMVHESVTRTQAGTERVLKGRKTGSGKSLGVQLMVDADGHWTCHNDLILERPIHGNHMNRYSIGLEVINPYTARKIKPPYTNVIPAKWWTWVPKGAPRKYVTPTDRQLRSLELFMPWLCGVVELPYAFPTADLNAKNRRIKGWKQKKRPGKGIIAHRDTSSHADGRYILEHLMSKIPSGTS